MTIVSRKRQLHEIVKSDDISKVTLKAKAKRRIMEEFQLRLGHYLEGSDRLSYHLQQRNYTLNQVCF